MRDEDKEIIMRNFTTIRCERDWTEARSGFLKEANTFNVISLSMATMASGRAAWPTYTTLEKKLRKKQGKTTDPKLLARDTPIIFAATRSKVVVFDMRFLVRTARTPQNYATGLPLEFRQLLMDPRVVKAGCGLADAGRHASRHSCYQSVSGRCKSANQPATNCRHRCIAIYRRCASTGEL